MPTKRTPRLLVVDDDPGVIAAYRLVLEKSFDRRAVPSMFGLDALQSELFGVQPASDEPEWRVTFIDQGLDALMAVKWANEDGDPFTAIFLDVRMPPGIDGYETAERIRKIDTLVHIVIVTGYSDYTVEDFVEIAGPENRLSYKPKPVWPEQLKKVARSLTADLNYRKAPASVPADRF